MGVAVRRDQHFRLTAIAQTMRGARRTFLETFNRLVILGVALSMVVFGYRNYLNGFGSFLMPSLTPITATGDRLRARREVSGREIGFIKGGRILAHGTPDALKRQIGLGDVVALRLEPRPAWLGEMS